MASDASAAVPLPPPIPHLPPAAAAGELEYHRLALRWKGGEWWRPLVGLAIAAGLYAAVAFVIGVVVFLAMLPSIVEWAVTADPSEAGPDLAFSELTDLGTPVGLLLALGSIIPMLPAVYVGFRLAGCSPMGLISSVAGRIRWTWLLWCLAPAAVVTLAPTAVAVAVQTIVDGALPDPVAPTASPLFFLLVLLLIPFQAAAEEYAFRGALMQAIGRWLRHPAWAILLPVPLFVLGHLYDVPGQLAVAVFAVGAAWLTWRTGGLEAAVALHVVNNLVAFALGGLGQADLNSSETGWLSFATSSLGIGVYVFWIDRVARPPRWRWRRTAPALAPFVAPPGWVRSA